MPSPEELTLTIVETFQDITKYKVIEIDFKRGINPPETSSISIFLEGDAGSFFKHRYEGLKAWNFIKFVNVENFSLLGKSLNTQILEKLDSDGIKVGVVSGDPE